jgi:hypothetical protein
LFDDFSETLDPFTASMLDNISESTTNHTNSQSERQQQPTRSNSQVAIDFDSILQELKSVGQAHQSEQEATMIIENITANIKQEPQTNSQNQSTNSNDTGKLFSNKLVYSSSDIRLESR